jgi:hypothetical protein
MPWILPVILGCDQPHHLRPINATGKSGAPAEMLSSDEQMLWPNLYRAPDAVRRHKRLTRVLDAL